MTRAGLYLARGTAAGLLAALATCGNAKSAGQAGAADVLAQQEETMRLSAALPSATIQVPVDLERPDALTFTVSEVRNPAGSAIRITVSLRMQDDTTRSVHLGAVALFPVDQGGTFSLRLPPEASELLARPRRTPVQLQVTLVAEPPPPNGATEPALVIGQFKWLRTGN
jgi:hypothetical protein